MKVHLYDVRRQASQPMENILKGICQHPLATRMRTIGNADIRLENCVEPHSPENNTPYWLLDFTNLRFKNGPAKANRTAPMTGFNIGPDEGFGEETAALYDPHKRILAIQYNHHGPRATSVCSYINSFDPSMVQDYEFTIRMDNSATTKLSSKKILTKLTVKITPPKIDKQMRNGGTSLQRALQISDELDGSSIEITVSAGQSRNAKLNHSKAHILLKNLKTLLSANGAVERIEVSGRTDANSPVELIDLIEEKIEAEIDGLVLGPGLRYTQDSRWNALIRARNGWNNVI